MADITNLKQRVMGQSRNKKNTGCLTGLESQMPVDSGPGTNLNKSAHQSDGHSSLYSRVQELGALFSSRGKEASIHAQNFSNITNDDSTGSSTKNETGIIDRPETSTAENGSRTTAPEDGSRKDEDTWWECDFCGRAFPSLERASSHEEQCHLNPSLSSLTNVFTRPKNGILSPVMEMPSPLDGSPLKQSESCASRRKYSCNYSDMEIELSTPPVQLFGKFCKADEITHACNDFSASVKHVEGFQKSTILVCCGKSEQDSSNCQDIEQAELKPSLATFHATVGYISSVSGNFTSIDCPHQDLVAVNNQLQSTELTADDNRSAAALLSCPDSVFALKQSVNEKQVSLPSLVAESSRLSVLNLRLPEPSMFEVSEDVRRQATASASSQHHVGQHCDRSTLCKEGAIEEKICAAKAHDTLLDREISPNKQIAIGELPISKWEIEVIEILPSAGNKEHPTGTLFQAASVVEDVCASGDRAAELEAATVTREGEAQPHQCPVFHQDEHVRQALVNSMQRQSEARILCQYLIKEVTEIRAALSPLIQGIFETQDALPAYSKLDLSPTCPTVPAEGSVWDDGRCSKVSVTAEEVRAERTVGSAKIEASVGSKEVCKRQQGAVPTAQEGVLRSDNPNRHDGGRYDGAGTRTVGYSAKCGSTTASPQMQWARNEGQHVHTCSAQHPNAASSSYVQTSASGSLSPACCAFPAGGLSLDASPTPSPAQLQSRNAAGASPRPTQPAWPTTVARTDASPRASLLPPRHSAAPNAHQPPSSGNRQSLVTCATSPLELTCPGTRKVRASPTLRVEDVRSPPYSAPPHPSPPPSVCACSPYLNSGHRLQEQRASMPPPLLLYHATLHQPAGLASPAAYLQGSPLRQLHEWPSLHQVPNPFRL